MRDATIGNMSRPLRFLLAAVLLFAIGFLLMLDISIESIIQTTGVIGLALTIFAETGLLIGFFLPGDTLLFTAGFFAGQGQLNLFAVLFALFIGAVLGNAVGYEIGRRAGPKLFRQEESIFFSKESVEKTQHFFDRHGGKTIVLARFIPVVRTLSPLMAGVAGMNYRRFMTYNVVGALIWIPSITIIGYWAGKVLGEYFNIDHYILPVLGLVMFTSAAITFWHIWKDQARRTLLKASVKRNYSNFFKK